MNKPVCTPPQLNFWIICALFMIVAVSPQLDLAVSAFFFRDNRFYLGDWGFFPFLRRGLPEIFIGIAAAFGLIWGWGLLRRRWLWGINTKVMLLTTGSMLLGPILIVNGIFKTFWGRARPYFQPMRLGLLFHVRTHGRHLLEPGSGTAASAPVPQMGNKRGYYPRNSHRNCPHSPRLTFCL